MQRLLCRLSDLASQKVLFDIKNNIRANWKQEDMGKRKTPIENKSYYGGIYYFLLRRKEAKAQANKENY